jgi:hypothetical protein
MTSIDEDGKLHSSRAAYVAESIEGCSNSSSREKHIIDKDHCSVFDTEGGNTRGHKRSWSFEAKIVTKKCCIQGSYLYRGTFDLFNQLGKA